MRVQRLLYRDEHLVVVDKPSGLASHRGWARDRDTALSRARDMVGARVYLPHRLDRGTSGVLVMALDEDTHRALCHAFEHGAVEKRYLALVRGHAPASGRVDHPLRAPGRESALQAVTDFALVAHSPRERCSLLSVQPRTGRPHQIRRHLKHVSHPLLGDSRYGKGPLNRDYRERYGLARLALHAEQVAFEHPRGGPRVVVSAPLPPDLAEVLAALGLAADSTP